MINKSLLCFFIVFTFCKHISGQTLTDDSAVQNAAIAHIIDDYNTSIGQQSRLFSGPEYDPYSPLIKSNAYFQDVNEFKKGLVVYDGFAFNNVPMMYDLFKDKLGVLLYNNFSRYSLLSDRVKSFDLLDHHFIYVAVDSLNTSSSISSGFYDEGYSGNLQVLAKWVKTIQTASSATTLENSLRKPKVSFILKKAMFITK